MNLFGDDIEDENEDDFHSTFDENDVVTDKSILYPPVSSDFYLGNSSIEQDILNLWNTKRMPHALIFNGLKGIGKATFAYRLARFILKESSASDGVGLFGDEATLQTLSVSKDHPVFTRVASGGHPDMMVVSRPFDERKGQFKDDIPVDDIRKIAPFLRKTSSNGGWRIVIVDDANSMNRNGQNALLKILEEPPKHALLILVTHGAGGLLPTIRSRCRFISFSPLENEHLQTLLDKASDTYLTMDDKELISSMADGSAGQAIELLQTGGFEQAKNLLAALPRIKTLTSDQIDALALSYGKSGAAKSVHDFTFIINWWFETLIYLSTNGQKTIHIGGLDLRVPEGYTLQSLLRLHEEVFEHIETCIKGNLDKRYMIYKTLRMIQG